MPDLSSLFLLIFVVSLGLTLVSLFSGVSGAAHLGGLRLGHAGHGLRLGHSSHSVVATHGGHAAGTTHGHVHHAGGPVEQIAPLNTATVLAFMTWLGGVGFLLISSTKLAAVVALLLAMGAGLVGAGLVFVFLARILLPGQTDFLEDSDFELVGMVGRVSVGIRPGGTGELVYSRGGGRHVLSARTEDGAPLERGSEVVVVRYERGIAFVELFDAFVHARSVHS